MRSLFPVLLLPLFLLLALGALGACGDETPGESPGTEVIDRSREIEPGTPTFGIYNALKAMGAPVEVGDPIETSALEVPGRALVVNGSQVELYEFASKQDADAAAATVSSDGAIGGMAASEPAHWYRSEVVLVVYRGSDPVVMSALESTLGGQFAGAR